MNDQISETNPGGDPGAAPTRIPTRSSGRRTRLAIQVHVRLATCRNLLMRGCRSSVERWALTLPQFDVLAELARAPKDGFTFVEVSRKLLVTSGNLTGIVDRLEAQRLVRRKPDAVDRRVIRVCLTEKGRRLTKEVIPAHAGDVADLLSAMPAEALEQLSDLLNELRQKLNARPRATARRLLAASSASRRSP